jgi:alpha-glucosidase
MRHRSDLVPPVAGAAGLVLMGLLLVPQFGWAFDPVEVASPDGQVTFQLSEIETGRLGYAVRFRGKPVIELSALGIVVDGVNLGVGIEVGDAERYQVDETYPWHGVHSTAVNKCNGARIAVTHSDSRAAYTLDVRAYDSGIAFRHLVPGKGRRVPTEATVFRVPAQGRVWVHDAEDHYEGRYAGKSVRAVPPGAWVAPPLTVRLPDDAGYAAITEGGLREYSGMMLQGDGEAGFHARLGHAVPASWPFRLRFAEDVERLSNPAAIEGTITTPWRVVMIGADLNALANSDIVHNVAAPPDAKLFPKGIETEWLQPGRSVWSYLDGGTGTLEGMKEFSRLAGELGFEYSILEGFWARWPESELKELADYSRERGVRILVWKRSAELRDPKVLREFFAMCRRTGVAGAKIDFFDHEHKEVVDTYEMMLKAAAEHELVLDFHGSNKPTGLERTYPNLLGLEGIRGLEMGPPYAQHNTTLPFTRMLAGLADYTPTHFGRRLADTTWPHQIANAVILWAPLLVYAAHPANILANPAVDVIKEIPSVWDETVVLPVSEIGEVAAFARRSGDTWFLAVTNGPNARTIEVDLSFLDSADRGRDPSYYATLVSDAAEADAVAIERKTMSRGDSVFIKMRSGGGFVGMLSRSFR